MRARDQAQKARRAARAAAAIAGRYPTDDRIQEDFRSIEGQAEKAAEAAAWALDIWRQRWPGASLRETRGQMG